MAVNRQFDGDLRVEGVFYPTGGIPGYVQEAPLDYGYYVRQDGTWVALTYSAISGTPPGLADAPSDGVPYARKNAAWFQIWNLSPSDVTGLAGGVVEAYFDERTVTGTDSITGGGDLTANRTFALVGDSASPGNSKYYGTNGSGTKGWHALPAGGGGSPPITKKTADYTATDSDGTIICTPSADMTITLPVSGLTDGRIFSVVRTGGTGNVSVVQSGGSTLRTINTVGGAGGWVWCATDSTYYPISYVAGS